MKMNLNVRLDNLEILVIDDDVDFMLDTNLQYVVFMVGLSL